MVFITELKRRAAEINQALELLVPGVDTYPSIIHEAVRYSLMAGGKRLRPILVLAAAETLGEDPAAIMPVACALELVHTYSLVHDDLPAMDNDDYRRGRLTNHKVYGEAMAVLAGDALLTMAFELIADCAIKSNLDAGRFVRVIAEVARASGTAGMIGGQVVDTFSADQVVEPSTLDYIHRHKTGALYRVSVRTGAILAGADDKSLAALTQYAENLGLAFQIQDDILDVEGDEEKLGKPVGSDEKNKKATYPALFGMAEAKKKAVQVAESAQNALEMFDERADFLRQLVYFVIKRDF